MKGRRVLRKRYEQAGVYDELVEAPNEPMEVPLFLRMRNEHEQLFQDEILLAFHFHYDRVLKVRPFQYPASFKHELNAPARSGSPSCRSQCRVLSSFWSRR